MSPLGRRHPGWQPADAQLFQTRLRDRTLDVAGPRESMRRGVGREAQAFLEGLFDLARRRDPAADSAPYGPDWLFEPLLRLIT
jgi:hypothetical protein